MNRLVKLPLEAAMTAWDPTNRDGPADDRHERGIVPAEQGGAEYEEPAPSLPVPFAKARLLGAALGNLHAIGDFEILGLLGEGAFGKVFRARQLSLDRYVALKVTANLGQEGRTMARLEHPRVVQVFSESVDAERGLRLLCMQLVAGATLQQVIDRLARQERRDWSGQTILRILDELSFEPATLDPASLRDRETLAGCSHVEAVCWIGQQLAETLAYAHSQHVLHLDVKPANVLLNQYGQPILTDFSVSLSGQGESRAGAAVIGGTLGYMAPEHLGVFHPERPAAPEAVDERSDIYSLGAVLLDFFLGRCAALSATTLVTTGGRLGIVAAARDWDSAVESLRRNGAPRPLERIIGKCLQTDPRERFSSAAELAAALEGCRELIQAERSLPSDDWLNRFVVGRPLRFCLLLTILPNFVASAANIAYLALLVVADLPEAQRAAFWRMVLWYNVVVVALMIAMVDRTLLAAARGWRFVDSTRFPTDTQVAEVRRKTLALSTWVVVLSCVGWLPFVAVIPLGMELMAGPVEKGALWHISVAYLLTGMISLVCNYFVVSFVVVRSLYTRYWGNTADFRVTTASELEGMTRRNRVFQILAGATPLAAAALLVAIGPEQFTPAGFLRFRSLLFVLLVAGVASSWLANRAAMRLNEFVGVLTAAKGDKSLGPR
jgi:serine/threonine protein kinase